MEIPKDSPLRYKTCDRQFECALENRPKDTEPYCPPGRVKNGGSSYFPDMDPTLGPCCTAPSQNLKCDTDDKGVYTCENKEEKIQSIGDTLKEQIQDHPLIASAISLFLAYKIYTGTKGALLAIKTGKKAVTKLSKGFVEQIVKLSGKAAEKLSGAAAKEAAAKIAVELEEQAGKKLLTKMTERFSSRFLAMEGNLSLPVVGEILDLLMIIGMIIDFADYGGYRQYINSVTYLDIRDAIEGARLKQMETMGIEPPFHFTMGMLKLSYESISEKEKDTESFEGNIIDKIYTAFIQSVASHMEDAFKEGQENLSSEDNDLLDTWLSSIIDTENPPQPPESLIDKLTSAFTDEPKERANSTWKYMKANLKKYKGYIDYLHFDISIADEHNYGIN